MGKNVFIPMTRMNLLGCLDSLILAPPAFLKKRKHYEDFTGCFPLHILAFDCPVLPPLQPVNENEGFNFPVLVEIELPSTAGIKTIVFSDTGIETLAWKKAKTGPGIGLLISDPLILENIQKVYVETEDQRKELSRDPLYEDRGYPFSVEIYNGSVQQTGLFELAWEHTNDIYKIKGYSPDAYENSFKISGGMAMLAEVLKRQNWGTSNSYKMTVTEILDTFIEQYIALEEYDFSQLDYFRDPENIKDRRLNELKIIFEKRIKAKKVTDLLFDDSPADNQVEENANILADKLVLKLLIKECINGHPKKITATGVLGNLQQSISKTFKCSGIRSQTERVEKGLQLIQDIMAGRKEVDLMFSAQTLWARSLRAATLFCLRPEPVDMINWTKEQKPAKAELSDYFRAAFLCGLYHGFSRLSWNVKKKWAAFMNIPVRNKLKKKGRKKQSRDFQCSWEYRNNQLYGKSIIIYPGKDLIVIKTQIGVNSLVQDFCDKVFSMSINGTLGIKEKAVLSIMANQMGLKDKNIQIVSNQLIQPGKALTINEEELKIHKDWDYKTILEKIIDSNKDDFHEELIHLVSHYLGYRTHEFEHKADGAEIADDNIRILVKIDSFLEEALKDLEDFAEDYPALKEIHASGVRLGHELINLLRTKNLNNGIRKEIQSALLYLVLKDDVISEEMDPVFGMIDDWIWLGHTAKKIALSKKGISKKIEDISEAGTALHKKISEEFGEQFLQTIIRKIDIAFRIRKWVTD